MPLNLSGNSLVKFQYDMVQNGIDTEVTVSIEDNEIENIPNSEIILSIYPNPFNPTATISFELNIENTENTGLVVYNLKGQKVKQLINDSLPAGKYSVVWNAEDKASGIYFVKIKSGDIEQFKKIVLIK